MKVVNPKLSEMAVRSGGFGGKGGRWGYSGGFKGRENNGPRQHQRFPNNGGFKTNGFKKGKSILPVLILYLENTNYNFNKCIYYHKQFFLF
ncbi:hypothetical protein NQ314_006803 [Rhamnusium bicolor]|uniref:Uncharacterized protein n=1 Tax=Rhamnusium bicolor TaxID=1586634 RepID=A0AAV8YWK0_9CUCU|nr:hypothetical protein NQ314_006803 [Rhamnusium bicolor]